MIAGCLLLIKKIKPEKIIVAPGFSQALYGFRYVRQLPDESAFQFNCKPEAKKIYYQGSLFPSLKKPPVGPSSGSRAAQITLFALTSTGRPHIPLPKESVVSGQTELTRIWYGANSLAILIVRPFRLPAGDDDLVSHLAELLRRLKPDPALATGASCWSTAG